MRTNHCHEMIEMAGLGGQRSRCRILQEELLNTFACRVSCKLGFLELIAWCKEYHSLIVTNSVCSSPRLTNALDSLLTVIAKISLAGMQFTAIFANESLQLARVLIYMAYSFENAILSNVL